MSPDIDFKQFSERDLKTIADMGESNAGYRPFQRASVVRFWLTHPDRYQDYLDDPTRTTLNMTETEIAAIEAVLGRKLIRMPQSDTP